jgi:ADP-heptose:LPS heptosyltransferase
MKILNLDYFRISKEFPLLLRAKFIHENGGGIISKRVLIVNSCLIGDFVVSIPALREFIKKSKSQVDLLVSHSVKELAERIRGVGNVYVSSSSSERKTEKSNKEKIDLKYYDEVIIIKISPESYKMLKIISAGEIKSPFYQFLKYAFHVTRKVLIRKNPKRFGSFIFEVLGHRYKNIDFKELFDFKREDYLRVKRLPVMKTKNKIVIVHTSAPWKMKRWDNDKWAELIKRVNDCGKFRFVFIGASRDEERDYEIIRKKLNFKVYSLINSVKLEQLILVLRMSEYFIGIDSGPRNMANLAGSRSITLSGSGFNMFMPNDKRDVFIHKSPWGTGIYQLFFKSSNSNVKKITVDEVFKAFKRISRR